jgi:NADPH:quinone reductase-like Zn-dependent oxidoreductase
MKLIAAAAGLFACVLATGALAAPPKMQAIVQAGGKGADALRLQTIDTPKPAADQVLIKVYATSVNPVEWKRRQNGPVPPADAPPLVPGFDIAGVVDSVGAEVRAVKPGDAVVALGVGAYAQYALAREADVAKKPAGFTFEQASGMPIAGTAGWRAADEAKLRAGQRVAVIGAAGGAGSVAVVVARDRGARVVAVGHSSQQAYLEKLGAHEFVAYDRDDVASRVGKVDAVLNMVDSQVRPALAYVKAGGYFTSIIGVPGEDECRAAQVTCVPIAAAYNLRQADVLREMGKLADAGKYSVAIARVFPLAQAGEAQELNRTSDTAGKIVLSVDPKSSQR